MYGKHRGVELILYVSWRKHNTDRSTHSTAPNKRHATSTRINNWLMHLSGSVITCSCWTEAALLSEYRLTNQRGIWPMTLVSHATARSRHTRCAVQRLVVIYCTERLPAYSSLTWTPRMDWAEPPFPCPPPLAFSLYLASLPFYQFHSYPFPITALPHTPSPSILCLSPDWFQVQIPSSCQNQPSNRTEVSESIWNLLCSFAMLV